jgi:small subunit ribosomal protein S6
MREYELYLVIDAEAEEEAASAILDRLTQLITKGEGEVTGVDSRGTRRLAYPIRKKQESQDIILTFQGQPAVLAEMERILKLDERVLRHLLVRTDED